MAHLPQRAKGESGEGAAAERRQKQLIEPRLLAKELMDPGNAAERAAEDAGVNQRWTLQQQKQRENQQPAANAIALAHLSQPRHYEGEDQAAQR
jgi:hypothetical protein